MSRAHISAKTDVTIAIRQAVGGYIRCTLCGGKLLPTEPRVREHMIARAIRIKLGLDPDAIDILGWVHERCAAKKTRGCEGTSKKHSVANGDTHKIAKADRIADGGRKARKPFPTIPEAIKERNRQRQKELRARIKAERRAT